MNIKLSSIFGWLLLAAVGTYFLSAYSALSVTLSWFGALNMLVFLLMGKDKLAAISNFRRTPESTFLLLGLVGGFPGLFAGRKTFNHKTTKRSFIIPMFALFIVQLVVAAYFFTDLEEIGLTKKEFPTPTDDAAHSTALDTANQPR